MTDRPTALRVLMVAACPMPTAQGTQVYIDELASAVARAGHEVSLLTYGHGLDIARWDESRPYRVVRARAVPGYRSLASGPHPGRPAADLAVVLAGRGLADQPWDLIVGHNYEGAVIGAALRGRLRAPLLYHAHNLMNDELATYYARRLRRLLGGIGGTLDRVVPRLADRVVAVSDKAASVLARQLRCRVDFVPPAVGPLPDVAPIAGAPLIYCGNLDGYQGLDCLLSALAHLPPGIRCTVVTPQARAARELLGEVGLTARVDVVVHANWPDVVARMRGARLALLPRQVPSGFPIKLINYLMAGLPVVACRGGAQGLGRAEGVVVVDDGDFRAFAAEILRLHDREPDRLALARKAEVAARRFGWEQQLPHMLTIYRESARADRRRLEQGGSRLSRRSGWGRIFPGARRHAF